MKNSIKNRINSFKYAIHGLIFFIKDTYNVRIHISATAVVCSAGVYFKLNINEWLWIVLCVFLVFTAEVFNSALEKTIDKVSPEKSTLAKRAKDMAAAAVLLMALFSVIVASIIFYPYIRELFN